MPRVHVVIPARFESTRLPGKPLAEIAGKPMVQHVYERCSATDMVDGVIVATDDQRIADVVRSFGGSVQLTSKDHPNGTARVAEVARSLSADIIVNVQGDEPLIRPEEIEKVVAPLINDQSIHVSSLMTPFDSLEEFLRPSAVKVVCDNQGFALFFTRWPIPFDMESWTPTDGSTVEQWLSYFNSVQKSFDPENIGAERHLGLYAYRREILLEYPSWQESPFERGEKLEQLTLLANGERIRMVSTPHQGRSVDTPADLEAVRKLMESL